MGEILNLIESVSGGFPSYFFIFVKKKAGDCRNATFVVVSSIYGSVLTLNNSNILISIQFLNNKTNVRVTTYAESLC